MMYTEKSRKKLLPLLLGLIAALCLPVFAGTQEEINQARQEQAQTQSEMASTQERLASLEVLKGDKQAYLSEIITQLDTLSAEFEAIQDKYDVKHAELVQIRNELEEARRTEQDQYNDMKLRIQYLYESNTGVGALEILFSGDSFTDFLNRSEAISELHEFDRSLTAQYEKTRQEIEAKEQKVAAEEAEIAAVRDEAKAKRDQINEIYNTVYNEMEEILNGITEAESTLAVLAARLAEQDSRLQALLIRSYGEELGASASANFSGSGSQTTVDGMNLIYLGQFTLTAYCPCPACNGPYSGTASGAPLRSGHTVAMGGVPFGTKLYINGTVYTVEDRGTPYGWVDIFFDTHPETEAFGMRTADVYLVN
ncbi:MAG: hypothetical protein IKG08_08390 [Eubacterium sp.]|nr:hypothetical protein [Eubacterium sp.]